MLGRITEKVNLEKSYSFTVEGYQLHYHIAGDGLPLVILHGFGRSGSAWIRTVPDLILHRQVIAVDLPGYGRSKINGKWRLREVATALAIWLQEMNLTSITLLGHSLGGAVAIYLTTLVPELIDRLVLVNAIGIPLQISLPTLIFRAIFSSLQHAKVFSPKTIISSRSIISDLLLLNPISLLESFMEIRKIDLRRELATIKIPALIIWGERDVIIPLEQGQTLCFTLPHATFVSLPNSGHRPHFTEPEQFSILLADFLQID